MKLAIVGLAAVLVAGTATVATAAPDRCEETRTVLAEHRAGLAVVRAAYVVAVDREFEYQVSKLGREMVAGEQETERLLAAMYEACG